jgi:hypothetical protein
MTRIIAAAVLLAMGGPLLAACSMQQSAQGGGGPYATYEDESNPYCGALGNCVPRNSAPYALRGNGW